MKNLSAFCHTNGYVQSCPHCKEEKGVEVCSVNGENVLMCSESVSYTHLNYRKLKEAGIGTYILFQETYHKKSYLELHPTGPKHDYDYHTEAMDRAMEGGIDDVGLGVLFGLEMYKYEFAGLIMHRCV